MAQQEEKMVVDKLRPTAEMQEAQGRCQTGGGGISGRLCRRSH